MKLNDYIAKKNWERSKVKAFLPLVRSSTIEKWIIEWYRETYDRLPPTWLADTTDVRKKIQ